MAYGSCFLQCLCLAQPFLYGLFNSRRVSSLWHGRESPDFRFSAKVYVGDPCTVYLKRCLAPIWSGLRPTYSRIDPGHHCRNRAVADVPTAGGKGTKV